VSPPADPGPAPAAGRLVVCPTPIGNLGDVTQRVLEALRAADVIACEDTRTTKVLLDRHGITGERVRNDAHAEARAAPRLVARLQAGETVALVSDAGMPGVSDPGLVLVRAALAAGVAVDVLPGPSAVTTAVVASGLELPAWRFAGFLPRRRGELEAALRGTDGLVAFESPRRLAATLGVLAELDPQRPVAVCRELTKLHEEVMRGTAAEVAGRLAGREVRGEVVLVVAGAGERAGDRAQATEAVRRLIEAGARPRAAATAVAGLTGLPANELYAAAAAHKP
jgi:16S rRNA (cytidine1402-2'-O)-methyltransferase